MNVEPNPNATPENEPTPVPQLNSFKAAAQAWVRFSMEKELLPKFDRIVESPLLWRLARQSAIGLFVSVIGLVAMLVFAGFKWFGNATPSWWWLVVPGMAFILGSVLFSTGEDNLKSAITEQDQKLTNIKEADFEQFDKILEIREKKARADFEQNLVDAFLMDSMQLSGVDFFGECSWEFQPGVNVLLGRNGYGKSLLLRSLAALLQRNDDASKDLFRSAAKGAFLEMAVQRNGKPEPIRRQHDRFTHSAGKIPILAIPDSRFVNRIDTVIKVRDDDNKPLDLRADGALHFLTYQPYGEMMRMLFIELCYDFLERRSFDQQVFGLLQKAIENLTGDRFRFHDVERVGRKDFRLLVQTDGNNYPLPIQYASQGTLSVLGVIGIIRSYLKAMFPDARDEDLLRQPAIVIVDELDAHLHPLWQQKLTGLLRDSFPNIQFVLSAHSPLVVAGCWCREVSVLRKRDQRFELEQLSRDFLGTPIDEIYEAVFGVEGIDQDYLRLANRAKIGFSQKERITELETKDQPTEIERRELARLVRYESMIRRAAEKKVTRDDDQNRIMKLEAKVESLQDELKANTTSQ